MGLFNRISTIVKGSINDIVDKVEDPETMVNQMVRDMETAIGDMKAHTASAIATVKLTERKLGKLNAEQEQWQRNAEEAIKAGNEELARKALARRKGIDTTAEIISTQLEESKRIVEKLKSEYQVLEGNLVEAKAKRDNLIAQKRAAETKKKLYDASNQLSATAGKVASGLDTFEGFSKFEEKIARQTAEVEAREEMDETSLESEFAELTKKSDLDDELAALKAKLG